MISIYQVVPLKNQNVLLYFSDGTVRLWNYDRLVKKATPNNVYAGLLKDDSENYMTVLNNTLAWSFDGTYSPQTCVDVDPLILFEESKIVEESDYIRVV